MDSTPPPDNQRQFFDQAKRVYSVGLAGRIARWWGVTAGTLGFVVGYAVAPAFAFLIAILAGFVAFRIARYRLYQIGELGPIPLFSDLLPAARQRALQNAPASRGPRVPETLHPRSAHVPRVDALSRVTASEVLSARLFTSMTMKGGKTGTPRERLREGVVKVTELGIAFLPNKQGILEAKIGAAEAAVVWEVATQTVGVLDYLDQLKAANTPAETAPTLDAWEADAAKQADAFVIAWRDLVGIFVGGDRTILERARDQGPETDDFVLAEGSPSLTTLFMTRRLDQDVSVAMREHVWNPKVVEFVAEFGESMPAGTSQAQVAMAAMNAAAEWMDANKTAVESTIRSTMAPAIEGYRELPGVVATKPWLFEVIGAAPSAPPRPPSLN
jgi:hypothetical protein